MCIYIYIYMNIYIYIHIYIYNEGVPCPITHPCDGDRLATDIKVAVFGGGSFGTAMACVLGRKGVPCTLVVRKADVVEQINENHVNPYYQSDLLLPSAVRATLDP